MPRPLARRLVGHQVRTVQQRGWAGTRNGELLRRAVADGFEILLTADRNLLFQQNLAVSTLGVIVLDARNIRLKDLLPLVPTILQAVGEVRPGEVRRVGNP